MATPSRIWARATAGALWSSGCPGSPTAVGHRMYIPVGLGTAQQPSILYVWNLHTHRLDHILDLQSQVPHEFEDCDPYRGDLLIQTNGAGLLRLTPRR